VEGSGRGRGKSDAYAHDETNVGFLVKKICQEPDLHGIGIKTGRI
jgi:hypothetical protein